MTDTNPTPMPTSAHITLQMYDDEIARLKKGNELMALCKVCNRRFKAITEHVRNKHPQEYLDSKTNGEKLYEKVKATCKFCGFHPSTGNSLLQHINLYHLKAPVVAPTTPASVEANPPSPQEKPLETPLPAKVASLPVKETAPTKQTSPAVKETSPMVASSPPKDRSLSKKTPISLKKTVLEKETMPELEQVGHQAETLPLPQETLTMPQETLTMSKETLTIPKETTDSVLKKNAPEDVKIHIGKDMTSLHVPISTESDEKLAKVTTSTLPNGCVNFNLSNCHVTIHTGTN